MNHSESFKLLLPHQHGVVGKKSCASNLLQTLHMMCQAHLEEFPVEVIYTDFALVHHRKLIHKLKAY